MSGRSFEPIAAILLFWCTLALHARQVDVRLRLDHLWTTQARGAFVLPCGGMVSGGGVPLHGSWAGTDWGAEWDWVPGEACTSPV